MAVWQVEFQLIPRGAVSTSGQLTPSVLAETDWWAGAAFPSDYQRRLAVVAPPSRSTSAGLETWGREDGDRVDVRSDRGRVTRVTVRVDVRKLDSRFGAALLLFVKTAGAVLVRGDGLIVGPTIDAYAGSLRGSSAWKHSNDTAAFLASQPESDEDDD